MNTVGTVTGAVASEGIRLRRRGLLLGWAGLTAVFAVLINFVMFQVSQSDAPPAGGPGVSFPSTAELLSSDGLVAGLGAASSMFGVVTLSFWALATASDYGSGLVRVLVAAQPRRWRLVIGKWVALALCTAAVTVIALVVNLGVAPVAAGAAGLEPTAWGTDLVPTLGRAGVDLYLALLVWGTLGMAVAVVTRSAGVAIGVGIGWVLLVEGVIGAAVEAVGDWLPGTTITALARGGTLEVSYVVALLLAAAYTVVSLTIAVAVFVRRDVTD